MCKNINNLNVLELENNVFICNLQKIAKLFQEMSLLPSTKGSIDVGLVSNVHHKISLNVGESFYLSNEGVLPILCITSYNASLSTWILD